MVNQLMHQVPQLRDVVSQILCREVAQVQEGYLVKDISLLLGNRDADSIYCVDSDPTRLDTNSVTSLTPEPYLGTLTYPELLKLNASLKNPPQSSE